MREFIDALTQIPADDFVDEQHAYDYQSLRLYVTRAAVVDDSEFPGEQPPVAWPLDDLATAGTAPIPGDDSLRCQVISGDDVTTVMPLLEGANQATPFRSGNADYTLVVRPLLPGESGC